MAKSYKPLTPRDVLGDDPETWPPGWAKNPPWEYIDSPDLEDLLKIALPNERAYWHEGGYTLEDRTKFLSMLQDRWRGFKLFKNIPTPAPADLLRLISGEYRDRMESLPQNVAQGIWDDAERRWYEGHKADATRKASEQTPPTRNPMDGVIPALEAGKPKQPKEPASRPVDEWYSDDPNDVSLKTGRRRKYSALRVPPELLPKPKPESQNESGDRERILKAAEEARRKSFEAFLTSTADGTSDQINELFKDFPQLRAEYDDAHPKRRKAIIATAKHLRREADKREQNRLEAEQRRYKEAFDYWLRCKERGVDSEKLPAANAPTEEVLKWYDETRIPQRPDWLFSNPSEKAQPGARSDPKPAAAPPPLPNPKRKTPSEELVDDALELFAGDDVPKQDPPPLPPTRREVASFWSHFNLRALIPTLVAAIVALVLGRYKEQGDLDWLPYWSYDIAFVLALLFGVYWLWTQPDIRSALRVIYNRRPKMIMPILIIAGAMVGGSIGAFGAWRIKRQWQRESNAAQAKKTPAQASFPQPQQADISESEKSNHEETLTRLAEYMNEGSQILGRLKAHRVLVPYEAETEEWENKVEKYLEAHKMKVYALRFKNPMITYTYPGEATGRTRGLFDRLYTRIMRLDEFIKEMSSSR